MLENPARMILRAALALAISGAQNVCAQIPAAGPITKAMLEGILAASNTARQIDCLYPATEEAGNIAPSRLGRVGLSNRVAPGQYVLYLSSEPSTPAESVARHRQIQGLSAFSRIGFFVESEVNLDVGSGRSIPAKAFTLTWEGWQNFSAEGPCLPVGSANAFDVVSFQKLPDRVGEFEIWRVNYRIGTRITAPWAKNPELQRAYRRLSDSFSSATSSTNLLRGKSGWFTEAQVTRRDYTGPPVSPEQVAALKINAATPALNQRIAAPLLQEYMKKNPGKEPNACLRLPYDAADQVGDLSNREPNQALFITFKNPRSPTDRNLDIRLTAIAWLDGLVRTGFATLDEVPEGVRYTIAPALKAEIDPTGEPGCMVIGELSSELLKVEDTRQSKIANPVGTAWLRHSLRDVRPWAKNPALKLQFPELQVMLDYGLASKVQYEASLGTWRVTRMTTEYPQVEIRASQYPAKGDGSGLNRRMEVTTDPTGKARSNIGTMPDAAAPAAK